MGIIITNAPISYSTFGTALRKASHYFIYFCLLLSSFHSHHHHRNKHHHHCSYITTSHFRTKMEEVSKADVLRGEQEINTHYFCVLYRVHALRSKHVFSEHNKFIFVTSSVDDGMKKSSANNLDFVKA